MPFLGQYHYVRARGALLKRLCAAFNVPDTELHPEGLCWLLKTNLYGFPAAQDHFDDHLNEQLTQAGWVLVCPDVTMHIWALYSKPPDAQGAREFGSLIGLLVKYVDDLRFSTRTEKQATEITEFLEKVYGKFRDIGDTGVMLGKNYVYHQGLDGPHTVRLVQEMSSTEDKYVKEGLAACEARQGKWKGAQPPTPLPIPTTFGVGIQVDVTST